MSVEVMSAIFKAEFRDLEYIKDGEKRTAKASTAKLVLLAIADNANEYGEAYPGYTKLEIKTALSRQGLADTIAALEYNGLLSIAEKPSRLHTNSYTVNVRALPAIAREMPDIVRESSHLTSTSQATLLAVVKPLDLNHHTTIIQPSIKDMAQKPAPIENSSMPLDWQIAKSAEPVTLPTQAQQWVADVDIACMNISKSGADLEPLARAFMNARHILPTGKKDYKSWGVALREMKTKHAQADHVTLAVQKLLAAKMTVADPWAVIKTVTDIANPAQIEAARPAVVNGEFYA